MLQLVVVTGCATEEDENFKGSTDIYSEISTEWKISPPKVPSEGSGVSLTSFILLFHRVHSTKVLVFTLVLSKINKDGVKLTHRNWFNSSTSKFEELCNSLLVRLLFGYIRDEKVK